MLCTLSLMAKFYKPKVEIQFSVVTRYDDNSTLP